MKAFGRVLTSYRLRAGFKTQEAAATAIGIERSRLVRHENGTGGTPQASTLQRYEQGYGLLAGTLMAILDGNVSESVPRGTGHGGHGGGGHVAEVEAAFGMPRLARNLPLAVREYLAEFQLRLVKGGATEDEIDEAMTLLRSPDVFSYFKGGKLAEYNEDDVLDGMRSLAEDVVIPRLQKLGRKVK